MSQPRLQRSGIHVAGWPQILGQQAQVPVGGCAERVHSTVCAQQLAQFVQEVPQCPAAGLPIHVWKQVRARLLAREARAAVSQRVPQQLASLGAHPEGIAQGLPHDELYIYEDALRKGRTVVIALADSDPVAEQARTELSRAGAESVDAAREAWWIGLRDAEEEHYAKQGGDFKIDEAVYRLGFEAALRPGRRDQTYDQAAANVEAEYRNESTKAAFRHGYERGLRYSRYIRQSKESKSA